MNQPPLHSEKTSFSFNPSQAKCKTEHTLFSLQFMSGQSHKQTQNKNFSLSSSVSQFHPELAPLTWHQSQSEKTRAVVARAKQKTRTFKYEIYIVLLGGSDSIVLPGETAPAGRRDALSSNLLRIDERAVTSKPRAENWALSRPLILSERSLKDCTDPKKEVLK